MKKTFTIIFLAICLQFQAQVPTPTLNFGIVSHNEMTTAEPYNTYTFYVQTRDTLRKIVDMITTKNAKYNLQTCQKFVLGCLQHEFAATTNTDILQYAYERGGAPYGNVIEVDPRYKTQSPMYMYNIADVSKLIDSTGANSSKNLGGFVYYPYPGDWMTYASNIVGTLGKNWKADVLWGAGTGAPLQIHSHDANDYGTWKPRSDADSLNFYCHDPSKSYWMQGNGCAWNLDAAANTTTLIADIRLCATKVKNGTYPANKFYNTIMMINFKDFQSPNFRVKVTQVVDSVNLMVAQGLINWKTISQKHSAFLAWSTANSIPFSQWRCGQTVTLTPTCTQPNGINELNNVANDFISLYPVPANNKLMVSWSGQLNEKTILELFDATGRKVYSQNMKYSVAEVQTENLSSGVYTVIMLNDAGQSKPEKIVIQH